MGGMPYNVLSKLFDSMVRSVIAYGASVWGTKKFACIEAMQLRARSYFLCTGKYTPSAAVAGEMGWTPLFMKQYKSVCIQWVRYLCMHNDRVNKRIFCC